VKICVFGAGAIGGYAAAQLWHTDNDVCVVARGPHLEAIRRHGLKLIAAGRETIARIRASDQPSEPRARRVQLSAGIDGISHGERRPYSTRAVTSCVSHPS
jgi:ketopantoate reductase